MLSTKRPWRLPPKSPEQSRELCSIADPHLKRDLSNGEIRHQQEFTSAVNTPNINLFHYGTACPGFPLSSQVPFRDTTGMCDTGYPQALVKPLLHTFDHTLSQPHMLIFQHGFTMTAERHEDLIQQQQGSIAIKRTFKRLLFVSCQAQRVFKQWDQMPLTWQVLRVLSKKISQRCLHKLRLRRHPLTQRVLRHIEAKKIDAQIPRVHRAYFMYAIRIGEEQVGRLQRMQNAVMFELTSAGNDKTGFKKRVLVKLVSVRAGKGYLPATAEVDVKKRSLGHAVTLTVWPK
ncbi:MAG: hypothetical protein AAGI44_16915 [Pseudomonadota bacterium]